MGMVFLYIFINYVLLYWGLRSVWVSNWWCVLMMWGENFGYGLLGIFLYLKRDFLGYM